MPSPKSIPHPDIAVLECGIILCDRRDLPTKINIASLIYYKLVKSERQFEATNELFLGKFE